MPYPPLHETAYWFDNADPHLFVLRLARAVRAGWILKDVRVEEPHTVEDVSFTLYKARFERGAPDAP